MPMTDASPCSSCRGRLSRDDVYCPACGARRPDSELPAPQTVGATRLFVPSAAEPCGNIPLCPTCHSPHLADARFCTQCGASLRPAVEPDAWTDVRRQLEQATAGEFEIVRELGRGGMAAVYVAKDLALGRNVAIKVMAPGLLMGEGMVARFRQEAVTVASLLHPNIVTIHAVRQAGSLHFFIMQLVAGGSLDAVLKRTGPLPVPLVQAILYQVGTGLAHAHGQGVVHRDIKPANVLLDVNGNVILTDFGIAKAATASHLTQTGSTLGTPSYMSPEQCLARELSGASDQYSLGVVAYEMLVGRPPFTGSPFEIMQAHTMGSVSGFLAERPDCPPEIEAAVLRMLARDPGSRFPSVAEAIEAVGGYLPGPRDPLRLELARLVTSDSAAPPPGWKALTPIPTPHPSPPRPAEPTPPAHAVAPVPRPRGRLVRRLVAGAVAVVALGALALVAFNTPAGEPGEQPAGTIAAGGDTVPAGERGALSAQDSVANPAQTTQSESLAAGGSRGASPSQPGAQAATQPPVAEQQATAPGAEPRPAGQVRAVSVRAPTSPLEAGQTLVLRSDVTARPSGYLGVSGLVWTSSAPDVAAVSSSAGDSALVSLLREGEATLTAAADAVRGSALLRVRAAPPVASVALAPAAVELELTEGAAASADRSVRVTVTGSDDPFLGIVQYDAGARDWLRTSLTAAGQGAVLTVRADGSGLAAGSYQARVPVGAGPARQVLAVRLTVAERPVSTAVEPSAAAEREIGELLAAYATAINTRNESRVRELYPSLPSTAYRDLTRIQRGDIFQLLPLAGTLRAGRVARTLDVDVSAGIVPATGAGQTRRMTYTVGRNARGWYIVAVRTGG